MKTRLLVCGLLVTLLVPVPTMAEPIDPAKEADIRRLIEVLGGRRMVEQLKGIIFGQLDQIMRRNLPEGEPGERAGQILDTFNKKFAARFDAQELIERVVPIYDKYLTHEEIQRLIAFYESPLGQRVLAVLPDITQESFAVGAEWGRQIGQDVLREMGEEFPELKAIKP